MKKVILSTFLSMVTLTDVADDGERPNTILLLIDDQRWSSVGFMSNKVIETTYVDTLANKGGVIEKAFDTTSVCAPSGASIYTGTTQIYHGTCFGGVLPKNLYEASCSVQGELDDEDNAPYEQYNWMNVKDGAGTRKALEGKVSYQEIREQRQLLKTIAKTTGTIYARNHTGPQEFLKPHK